MTARMLLGGAAARAHPPDPARHKHWRCHRVCHLSSCVAPGLRVGGPSYTATVKIASRGMQLTSLPSDGAIGGSSGCDGNGAVVVLNGTGAASTVWCNMLA